MATGQSTLDTVVQTLSALPQVAGIGLGGSRASGSGNATSDYDISVFTTSAIPVDTRRALAQRFDPAPEIANTWWGESDYWQNGGVGFDVMFWDTAWFRGELQRVIHQHQPANGYTTALWFTARHLAPLFDRDGWLVDVKALAATPYPDALANAVIAYNHPLLRGIHTSYAAQIRRATELDDPVSVNHRIAELLKTAFDIVFAHFHELHPGEKRQLRTLATLPGTGALDTAIRALLVAAGDAGYARLMDRVDAVCNAVDAILAVPAPSRARS